MAESLQIKKVSIQHEAIVDRLLVEPTINKGKLAAELGITRTHLSVIINSDAFKKVLAERRQEISGPVIASLQEKLTALADSTLDALIEKVETVGGDMDEMRKVLDTALGGLGMGKAGQAPAGGTYTQININSADRGTLEEARRVMKEVQEKRKESMPVMIEGTEGDKYDDGTPFGA